MPRSIKRGKRSIPESNVDLTMITKSNSLDSLTKEQFEEELAKAEPDNDDSFMGRFFVPDAILKRQGSGEYQQVDQEMLEIEDGTEEGEEREEDTLIDLDAFYEKKSLQKKKSPWCSSRSLAIFLAIVSFVIITTAAFLVWGVAPAEEKAFEPKGIWFEDEKWDSNWFHKNNNTEPVDNSTIAEVVERVEQQPEKPKKAMGVWIGDEIKAKRDHEQNDNGGH